MKAVDDCLAVGSILQCAACVCSSVNFATEVSACTAGTGAKPVANFAVVRVSVGSLLSARLLD